MEASLAELIRARLNKEKQLPPEEHILEKLGTSENFFGYRIYLPQNGESFSEEVRQGPKSLIVLQKGVDFDKFRDSDKRFAGWPKGSLGMVLEITKTYETKPSGEEIAHKSYKLRLPTKEEFASAEEALTKRT